MNRQIIVTGGGKGLGLCLARHHAAMQDKVLALEYQITDALQALQREHPGSVSVKKCDVTDTAAVKAAVSDLARENTPVDIVYNVAGIFTESDRVPLVETDIDKALHMYNVNALGALRVMAAAGPLLHQGSVVLNVTSDAGSIGECTRESEYAYCMSKAAENMASKLFANEYRKNGVRVFCLHPGWMKTDMGGEGARLSSFSITPEESAEALAGIATRPEEIPDGIMYMDYKRRPLAW